jgi:hypothetical protein
MVSAMLTLAEDDAIHVFLSRRTCPLFAETIYTTPSQPFVDADG